jgi:dihydrofolate reductase
MSVVDANISMSVDGFVTGPNIDLNPGLGERGDILHAWVFDEADGARLIEQTFAQSGAVITSRMVYELTGGWGDDGLYQMPVFVLTHRPHEVVVKGKTTFTFVTDGIESAIAQAKAAAGEKKVHVMGGASVIRQALVAGLVDELTLHVAPVVLGGGTRLFDDSARVDLKRTNVIQTKFATHLHFKVIH